MSFVLEREGVVAGVRRVHTSPTQFRLLCHLPRDSGQIVSRDQLVAAVWKGTAVAPPDCRCSYRTFAQGTQQPG
ncbi:winged helix-turn-helix domain-containing protein [Bradyrhizobium sp. 138]|nr:winged helix-turn-helix domain-containing protein [Bradyrhizobium sp. 138]